MPKPASILSLTELCATFKAAPADAMVTVVVVGDTEALKMLAAFTRIVLPTWNRPKRKPPTERRALWLWLWEGYLGGPDEPIFLEDLARRAAVPTRIASARWPALVSSGLLYPDGTLHPDAAALIHAHVAEKLGALKKPR